MVHRRPRKLLADYLVTVHVLNKSLLTSAYPAAIPKRNPVERPQRQLSGLTPQCLIVPLAICDSQTSKCYVYCQCMSRIKARSKTYGAIARIDPGLRGILRALPRILPNDGWEIV